MKIITDSNLVPCERGRVLGLPITGSLIDISQDVKLANAIVAKVACVFDLSKTEIKLSGYARKEKWAFLYVQVWDGQQAIRTVAFRDVGYSGLLHVDLVKPEGGEWLYEGDFFGDIKFGMEFHSVDDSEITDRIWLVQNQRVHFEVYATGKVGTGRSLPSFGYAVGGSYPPS